MPIAETIRNMALCTNPSILLWPLVMLMRANLLRLKQSIDALRPIANSTTHSALLEPLHARAVSWLAVLESARQG